MLVTESISSVLSRRRARLEGLDILRGLAIAAMVILNLSGVLLEDTPPYILRFIGSIAAPVFIMLSGFMVALTAERHEFRYFLLNRSMWILTVAVFVDFFVWRLYPFMGVEVLYCIAASIPLAYLSLKLPSWQRLTLIAIVLALAPILRDILGYAHFPTQYYTWNQEVFITNDAQKLGPAQQWLVDGWFPLFPWLAFALIGAHLGKVMQENWRGVFLSETLAIGVVMTAVGAILYWVLPPDDLMRGVWTELFYPPSVQYTILFMGIAVSLLYIFLLAQAWPWLLMPLAPFGTIGKAALGMYVLHLVLAVHVGLRLTDGWNSLSLARYSIAYLATLGALWLGAQLFLVFRQWQPGITSPTLRTVTVGVVMGGVGLLIAAWIADGSAFTTGLHDLMKNEYY